MSIKATDKPLYQPWNDDAFWSDERVVAMTAVQRWMYRTLLQKAFFGSERPYLPVDDKRLWLLAGCESRAQWDENKELVLECFTVCEVDGCKLLSQKRLIADWARFCEDRQARIDKARSAAEVRWGKSKVSGDAPSMLDHARPCSTMPSEVKGSEGKGSESHKTENGVSIKKRLNEIAGKRIVTQNNNTEFELLARRYGKEIVIEDFTSWLDGTDGDLNYPGDVYLKIAESRLKSELGRGIILSDGRIVQIVAKVYAAVQNVPRPVDVAKLLETNEQDEIIGAFQEFSEGLDDYGKRFAAKNFFQDGAGEGIILARRLKREEIAREKLAIEKSLQEGAEKRRAESEALSQKLADEDSLAETLGDSPF